MKKPRNKTSAHGVERSETAIPRIGHRVTVLHVDDDQNDVELFRAAARKANAQFSIHNVNDGDQAMAYLNGRGIYADRKIYPLPVLILLDLKMPRATGFEVLEWIRNHPEAGNLPVVIFSGSELQDDIQQAYAVGADSYLVKPLGFNELVNLVKDINANWISCALRDTSAVHETGSHQVWEGRSGWTSVVSAGKAPL